MEIKSLAQADFDTIFNAFIQAFADYEMQLNKQQFQAMLQRRGFNPSLSFAAFDKDQIVAFTLNGIGNFRGISTAYDTGTGTLKEHRGRGLATKIFEYSIPHLKKRNIRQYLLEVLQHNTKAVSVYQKLGFGVSREFNYFRQNIEEVRKSTQTTNLPWTIKQLDMDEFSSVSDFEDFYPSWQNSMESIKRAAGEFISLGAFDENKLLGYCVFEPASGDVTLLAVDKQHRRKGIASSLFTEVLKSNKNDSVKVINTDTGCNSITGFLEAKNIELKGKQFEMIKDL